jgi:signal transduction histidine kinase
MKRNGRRSERWRLLVLELAIVLPALALILFSIVHLKSIQRDHAMEAAIQREFEQMLAMSDKQITAKAANLVDSAREDFSAQDGNTMAMLQRVLDRHPEIAHAFFYDQQQGVVCLSRQSRMSQPDFRKESEKVSSMVAAWLPLEGKEIVEKLSRKVVQGGRPVHFEYDFAARGDKKLYEAMAVFTLPGQQKDRIALGGVAFDAEYLKNTFFPQALDYVAECPENPAPNNQGAAMMLYTKDEPEPVAFSSNYTGGRPEVQRAMDTLPGLILGIKYRGTTISALSDHFFHTSYLVLAGLSLLMAGGIYLTYRNVDREVALAKLKSDFVSNVSHELRTPLASIRLYAETLEMGRLTSPEKYREYYRIIRKESERLTALINNILDFSRIEAGRKEYDFRETDLGELVRTTLDSYRYQFEQQGFAYEENVESGLPPVHVDREAIARSLLNLVNNAVKYSADNKYLRVNLYRLNGWVTMEVVDHGIGIPYSEHHKIFEKFYRACDPLVHNTKGSGLGLSLVRHVVEAHGGEVAVNSSPGQGSKFTITLPLNEQHPKDVHPKDEQPKSTASGIAS